MTFDAPLLLWLLVLLPVALVALRVWARQRDRRRRAYADPALLGAALHDAAPRQTRWPQALQLGALGLLLLGAAQPVAPVRLPSNQAAVMIALDTSRSMLADDVRPTRLAAAQGVIREFLRLSPSSTHIGFLTFSDRAAVLVAPTTDRRAVLDALARVKPAQATSLAGALVSAVRALPGREAATPPPELEGTSSGSGAAPQGPFPPGAVLLLSDGISNRGGSPLIAARFASMYDVKVYAVALGREGGAVSQIGGQMVFVPFDSRGLQRLSQLTSGEFLDTPDPGELQGISRSLGTAIRWTTTPLTLSAPLAGLAALLLIVGGGLGFRWHRRIP
ncbi:VWA domain-containing protein [Deinococcus sp. KSM4-11]|uniref:VWA domain-containing protein n=1 Tax=Deinococcus sp. KSM4-11 TaxID=2568654 RepID=UPI0010A2DF5C|nr:VWA domain-containing protein [Deinococcus sp. KSM4-11]THF86710.1 VWA domain-containing protein [Deinococcus sp. KSM4-11]